MGRKDKNSNAPATAADQAVAELIMRETSLLDNGALDEWLSLFTGDCIYWVPASHDQADPINHVSLFYENRDLMEMRIKRLQHPSAHSMVNQIHTSRVTGPAVIKEVTENETVASCKFSMTEYQDSRQRVFAGEYIYQLRNTGNEFLISMKQVRLINCDGVFEAIQVFI